MKEFKGHMSSQTIGHDKLNQLRHVQYFKTPENIRAHMADLAEVLRPKFDMVLNRLEEEQMCIRDRHHTWCGIYGHESSHILYEGQHNPGRPGHHDPIF